MAAFVQSLAESFPETLGSGADVPGPTPSPSHGGTARGWTRGLRFPPAPEPDWVEQLRQIAVADEDDVALILILANL
jgi:hypothetical protein